MGTHSLPRNSLTTDAISQLVVSHPPFISLDALNSEGTVSVLHIIPRALYHDAEEEGEGCALQIFCTSPPAEELRRRYNAYASERASQRMRAHAETRAGRTRANCPLSISLLHAPLYNGVYLNVLDEYTRPQKFGSFGKTLKSRLHEMRVVGGIMQLIPALIIDCAQYSKLHLMQPTFRKLFILELNHSKRI